jgi:hypothetical protein
MQQPPKNNHIHVVELQPSSKGYDFDLGPYGAIPVYKVVSYYSCLDERCLNYVPESPNKDGT